jgi:hypothetical protein
MMKKIANLLRTNFPLKNKKGMIKNFRKKKVLLISKYNIRIKFNHRIGTGNSKKACELKN